MFWKVVFVWLGKGGGGGVLQEVKGRGDDGVCLECSRRGEVEGMGLTGSMWGVV